MGNYGQEGPGPARPPFEGCVYVSARSTSGREWEVVEHRDPTWRLRPIGDDVQVARSETSGRWQGGVRSIMRTTWELRDEKKWRLVRTTSRARYSIPDFMHPDREKATEAGSRI